MSDSKIVVSVAPRFRVDQPPAPLRLPTREEIVVLALDVYRLALDHKQTYTNKRGVHGETSAPDFKAACEALKTAAEVSGYTRQGKKPGAQPGQEIEEEEDGTATAEEALKRLRSKLAKEKA